MLPLDWAEAPGCPGYRDDCVATSLCISSWFWRQIARSTDWNIHQMPARFFVQMDFYWGPVLCNDLHVTRQRRCRLMAAIYFLMVTVAQFMESLFTVSWNHYMWSRMEMMFEVFGLDTGRYMRNFYFLITYINKGINCHVICRTRKKEAGLFLRMRCFTLVFYFVFLGGIIKRQKSYLYHTACEQKRALWVADANFSSSVPLCLSASVGQSLCLISLSTHLHCFTMLLKQFAHLFVFQSHNNMNLC